MFPLLIQTVSQFVANNMTAKAIQLFRVHVCLVGHAFQMLLYELSYIRIVFTPLFFAMFSISMWTSLVACMSLKKTQKTVNMNIKVNITTHTKEPLVHQCRATTEHWGIIRDIIIL